MHRPIPHPSVVLPFSLFQCVSALARAYVIWGMGVDEGWLGRYLECIAHGLGETIRVNAGERGRPSG